MPVPIPFPPTEELPPPSPLESGDDSQASYGAWAEGCDMPRARAGAGLATDPADAKRRALEEAASARRALDSRSPPLDGPLDGPLEAPRPAQAAIRPPSRGSLFFKEAEREEALNPSSPSPQDSAARGASPQESAGGEGKPADSHPGAGDEAAGPTASSPARVSGRGPAGLPPLSPHQRSAGAKSAPLQASPSPERGALASVPGSQATPSLPTPSPPPAGGSAGLPKSASVASLADEATAAELLLGMGSASASPVTEEPGAAARGEEGQEPAPGLEASRSLRRRRPRPSERRAASEHLALTDSSLGSDDDFEPAAGSRPRPGPRAAAGAIGSGGARSPRGAEAARAAPPAAPPASLPLALSLTAASLSLSPGSTPTHGGGAPGATQPKSELTLLCERFQEAFGSPLPDGRPRLLLLNDVAAALGVPRRRLYDVINVLEALDVMRRVGKLMYEFCGYAHLPGLLAELLAEEEAGAAVEDRARRGGGDPSTPRGTGAGGKPNCHSLYVLSRRLVRMLLVGRGPITLAAAAAVLVDCREDEARPGARSQTQITVERRLYDIGSILCSVGLVDRIYVKKRQPAFAWVYGWRPGDAQPPPALRCAGGAVGSAGGGGAGPGGAGPGGAGPGGAGPGAAEAADERGLGASGRPPATLAVPPAEEKRVASWATTRKRSFGAAAAADAARAVGKRAAPARALPAAPLRPHLGGVPGGRGGSLLERLRPTLGPALLGPLALGGLPKEGVGLPDHLANLGRLHLFGSAPLPGLVASESHVPAAPALALPPPGLGGSLPGLLPLNPLGSGAAVPPGLLVWPPAVPMLSLLPRRAEEGAEAGKGA